MRKLLNVFRQALAGSIANPAGGGAVLLYVITLLALAVSTGLLIGEARGERVAGTYVMTAAASGMSLLLLIVGYIFNRPELYEGDRKRE